VTGEEGRRTNEIMQRAYEQGNGLPPEPSDDDLMAELERRLAAHQVDPGNVRTWDQILERVRRAK
jgi:putative addiction module component (TIGR02574 family)